MLTSSQYYGYVVDGLGYCLYQPKKGEVKDVSMPHNPTVSQQPRNQTNIYRLSSKWINLFWEL